MFCQKSGMYYYYNCGGFLNFQNISCKFYAAIYELVTKALIHSARSIFSQKITRDYFKAEECCFTAGILSALNPGIRKTGERNPT